MKFLDELKCRNVLRVGIAYAFELTTEDVKCEKHVIRDEPITPKISI